MDQTWAGWHHMIEEIGGNTGNTGNPEASSSRIQFTRAEGQLPPPPSNIPLIPCLESVHHVFT